MQDEISLFMADVYEAAGAFRASGQGIAAAEGLTLAQWHLMDAIVDPSTTVARAARRLGLTRQAVQKTANELVTAGLLEFLENPDHKTSPLIRITDTGLAVQHRLWARADVSHNERFGSLSAKDLETTRSTLRAMTEATYKALG
jgi:DNA-binding MarR family transcriptional regulator